jgi:tripartite-type tricarboxylate transporter receptor subunit TctC
MKNSKLFVLFFVVVFGTLVLSGFSSVFAADYPDHEITIVVPYNAGGASDKTSRIVATGMQGALGTNNPCCKQTRWSGGVGMSEVRAAKPMAIQSAYNPL